MPENLRIEKNEDGTQTVKFEVNGENYAQTVRFDLSEREAQKQMESLLTNINKTVESKQVS